MAIGYTELDFVNGSAPALSAANLNHIDEALKDACDLLDAETVAGRALATAADVAAQHAALGLGDSATKNVGTGAGDVAAGNAPAGAVTTHESTYAHANLPTAAGKTAADAIGAASGADTGAKIKTLVGDASTSNKGVNLLAADGGTTAGTVVQANDSRLQINPATWTPVPKFGGNIDDGTYTISENYYTKSGKKVHCEAIITWTVKGTKTGNFLISGMPLTSRNSSAIPAGKCLFFLGASSLPGMIALTINSSGVYLMSQGAASASYITDANFTATTSLRISFDYIGA